MTASSDDELLTAIRALARSGVDDSTLGRVVRSMIGQDVPVAHVAHRDIVPLKVRLKDGHATNISLPKALLDAVAASVGGLNEAKRRARELAVSAPQTNNRSGWVQDQLSVLVKGSATPEAQAANS